MDPARFSVPFSITRTPGAVGELMVPVEVSVRLHGPWMTTGAPLAGLLRLVREIGQSVEPVWSVPALAAWVSRAWSWVALRVWLAAVLLVVTVGGWTWPLLAA